QPVTLAVVDRRPVGKHFRDAVRAAWMKRRCLILPLHLRLSEHLARRRLVEARLRTEQADRFEHVQRADSRDLRSVDGLGPRNADEALRGKVIDLVGARSLEL